MKFADPTYLRYIHDGLSGGSINAENTSALPTGLVGMYEEAFPDSMSSEDRRQLLKFFTVWALLRKEAGAGLVAKILDTAEDKIIDQVAAHSSWFTSPVSGRYTLYHERLRAFVLQKISAWELTSINEAIISTCREALSRRLGDEDEQYALEFLSTHLLTAAMADPARGAELKKLAYDTLYWDRQLAVSKRFDWSRRLLGEMMQWAYMHDREEVIECALSRVDLHHREQNDAPRIVELVAEGDIDTALQRIKAFGGSDKEGLQRKFILYMLCLMEVTLLESKDKPFSRNACERLLKHLDDNIPVDDSILNWNDFFPSYLAFQMACVLGEVGLDYGIVFRRTDDWERSDYWEKDWITRRGPFNDLQFQVLLACARGIEDEAEKSQALISIASEFIKQGKFRDAELVRIEILEIASRIADESKSKNIFSAIATLLAEQGRLPDAIEIAEGIEDGIEKIRAQSTISIELAKLGKSQESLERANSINDEYWRNLTLNSISIELTQSGNYLGVQIIDDLQLKSASLARLSTFFYRTGESVRCQEFMKEAISIAGQIKFSFKKGIAIKEIVLEHIKQELFEDALNYFLTISSEKAKNGSLEEVIEAFGKKGSHESALHLAGNDSALLKIVAVSVAENSVFNEASKIADEINDPLIQAEAFIGISDAMRLKNNYEFAIKALFEAENCVEKITTREKYEILRIICVRYIRLRSSARVKQILGKFDDTEFRLNSPLELILIESIKVASYDDFILFSKHSGYNFVESNKIVYELFESLSNGLLEGDSVIVNRLRAVLSTFLFRNKLDVLFSADLKYWLLEKFIIGTNGNQIFRISGQTDDIDLRIGYIHLISQRRREFIQFPEFKSDLDALSKLIINSPLSVKGSGKVRERYIRQFIRVLLEFNFFDEAFEFVNSIYESESYDSSILKVIQNFLIAGKQIQLLVLINELNDKSRSRVWYYEMACHLDADYTLIANQILIRLLREIVYLFAAKDIYSISRIWLLALKLGHRKLADRIFWQYVSLINDIKDEWRRNNTYEQRCTDLLEYELFDSAIKMANLIARDEMTKGKILYRVSLAMFDSGREKEALELCASIVYDYYRIEGKSECILKYLLNDKHDDVGRITDDVLRDLKSIHKGNKPHTLQLIRKSGDSKFIRVVTLIMGQAELITFVNENLESGDDQIRWLTKAASILIENQRITEAKNLSFGINNKLSVEVLTEELITELLSLFRKLGELDLINALVLKVLQFDNDYSRARILDKVAHHFVLTNEFAAAVWCASSISLTANTKWISKSAYEAIVKGLLKFVSLDSGLNNCVKQADLIDLKWAKNDFWRGLGKELIKNHQINNALALIYGSETIEAKEELFTGLLTELGPESIDKDTAISSIGYLFNNPTQLESLMRLYGIHAVTVDNYTDDFLERLNRSLNIGWALDLRKTFSAA